VSFAHAQGGTALVLFATGDVIFVAPLAEFTHCVRRSSLVMIANRVFHRAIIQSLNFRRQNSASLTPSLLSLTLDLK
jgi:hypothetical protein